MKPNRIPLALLATLLVAAAAPAATAQPLRVVRGVSANQVAQLAFRLEDATRYGSDVADRTSYGRYGGDEAVVDAFYRLEDAARVFADRVDRGNLRGNRDDRAFRDVVARYYELRGEFRSFHGPIRVREAFHGINDPMERLYRIYTGRDLYRDDPNVRRRASRYDRRDYDRIRGARRARVTRPEVTPRDRGPDARGPRRPR